MSLISFSPNTQAKSADVNANFSGLANGSLVKPFQGYAITTTNHASSSTSFVDISELSASVTTTLTADIRICLYARIENDSAVRPCQLRLILNGSTNLFTSAVALQTSGFNYHVCLCYIDHARSAGTLTYKFQLCTDGANSDTITVLSGSHMTVEPWGSAP